MVEVVREGRLRHAVVAVGRVQLLMCGQGRQEVECSCVDEQPAVDVVFWYFIDGNAVETAAQSSFNFRCWFCRSFEAACGRRDCNERCQRRGMEILKSEAVGRTACQAARTEVVSRRRSVARRLWIVEVLGSARMSDLGTV